jgi:hypothetical protein
LKKRHPEIASRAATNMAGYLDDPESGVYTISRDMPPFLIISDAQLGIWVPDQRSGMESPSDFIYVNYPAATFCDNLFKRWTDFKDKSDADNQALIDKLKNYLQPNATQNVVK